MKRILVAAAVAASLIGTAATADAASRKNERGYHHNTPARMSNSPVAMRGVRPAMGDAQRVLHR